MRSTCTTGASALELRPCLSAGRGKSARCRVSDGLNARPVHPARGRPGSVIGMAHGLIAAPGRRPVIFRLLHPDIHLEGGEIGAAHPRFPGGLPVQDARPACRYQPCSVCRKIPAGFASDAATIPSKGLVRGSSVDRPRASRRQALPDGFTGAGRPAKARFTHERGGRT